jgi:hypothetical protein
MLRTLQGVVVVKGPSAEEAVKTKQLRGRVALTKRLEARGAIQSGPFCGCGWSIRSFRSANAADISIITPLMGGETQDLKGGGAFMKKTRATKKFSLRTATWLFHISAIRSGCGSLVNMA